jgi:hypothetical protein
MCAALIRRAQLSYPGDIHTGYKNQVLRWQARAMSAVNKRFAYIFITIIMDQREHEVYSTLEDIDEQQ